VKIGSENILSQPEKVFSVTEVYNPPSYSNGSHNFFSRNLSGLSGEALISLTLVTIDFDYFNYAFDTYKFLHIDAPLKNIFT